MRGYRYCEAVAAASAFGWYIYPPLSFSLVWDGVEIAWTYAGAEDWYPLSGAQFPGFRQLFEQVAPDPVKPLAPPLLAVSREPGVVQIWSGYLARTAPGWALLSRGPANIPRTQGYEHFEGIIESETWFGPLFTNIRLTRTDIQNHDHSYPLLSRSDGASARTRPTRKSAAHRSAQSGERTRCSRSAASARYFPQ